MIKYQGVKNEKAVGFALLVKIIDHHIYIYIYIYIVIRVFLLKKKPTLLFLVPKVVLELKILSSGGWEEFFFQMVEGGF